MKVIGAQHVEEADGVLWVDHGDILTPLARERARELGVALRTVADVKRPREPRSATEDAGPGRANPLAVRAPRALEFANPLYRRSAPVAAGLEAEILADRGRERRGDSDDPTPRKDDRRDTLEFPRQHRGRVTVVGAGHVGTSAATYLAQTDRFGEITLVDVLPGRAAGMALDLWHAAPLFEFDTRVRGTTELDETAGSEVVVITAGRPRQPGMSRTDLTDANSTIMRDVCAGIRRNSPEAIVIVVTNPLDEMTSLAWRETGFPPSRVLGMAGVLDAARFAALAALEATVRPDAVDVLALGSHGDEMVIPLSRCTIDGRPIRDLLGEDVLNELVSRTRESGAEIVGLLGEGSAYLAPGAAITRMVLAIAEGTGEMLPACVHAQGAYGIKDIYLGLPARLGQHGVEEVVEVPLEPAELEQLRTAAARIAERSQLVG